MRWDELPRWFPDYPGADRWLPALREHWAIIEEHLPAVRVTSVSADEAVRRHFAESLELLRVALAAGATGPVVDVGSGGGFPGIVIAVIRPDWNVHLVEPLKKRANLLQVASVQLQLGNVHVHPVRAEEAGRGELRESAGLVTARAVAPLPELLEYCAPLARPGGLLVLPQGEGAAIRLQSAAVALDTLTCEVVEVAALRPEVSDTPAAVVIQKRGPTPAAYPRRAGIPRKRPLV